MKHLAAQFKRTALLLALAFFLAGIFPGWAAAGAGPAGSSGSNPPTTQPLELRDISDPIPITPLAARILLLVGFFLLAGIAWYFLSQLSKQKKNPPPVPVISPQQRAFGRLEEALGLIEEP